MEQHCQKLCLVLLAILLFSCIHLHQCRKLYGYKFPVFSTFNCPRNEREWNVRSSALNCTEKNSYLCLPNKNLTQLLEFCYKQSRILIEEGHCLYLVKSVSLVDAYNCEGFRYGCPKSSYFSTNIFEYPSCITIGNGCFRAEKSCTSTTTLPSKTTVETHLNTTHIDYSSVLIVLILLLLGFVMLSCILCIIFIYFGRKRFLICCEIIGEETHQYEEFESIIDEKESLFNQWEEDDNDFVSTKVCDEVENEIKSHNLVIVSGHSGSGKSAICQHIALKYREKGWNVKPLSGVQELINIFVQGKSLKEKTILVLNDPFGKEFFDEIVYNSWITYGHALKSCFETTKLLMSCSASVLSEYRLKKLIKDTGIVQIDIGKNKLTKSEKIGVLNRYKSDTNLSEEEVAEIIQTEAYFPLLCKLYFRNKENQKYGTRFFKEPENVVKEEIRNYKTTNKESYCALVLLVLFNNNLRVDDLTLNTLSKQKYKHAQKLCGINDLESCKIGDSLESMKDFFVRKIDDSYQFYHDFVMEATTSVFGEDNPKDTIEYGNIGFLRRRVRLQNYDEQKDSFTIYLNDTYIDKLGERLFHDILGVDFLEVVLNPCLKDKKVYDVFVRKMDEHPEKLHLFLEKKRIEGVKQTNRQTICKSFLTNITFLSLEKKMSPLFALITFCHTEISLHCLQPLDKTQDIFINSCLFSAVCCSGSMDLLNIFSEKIEKFLNEKWGNLYPIHIASAFLNHEILCQLLLRKVDVNLRTDDEDGCTPLILAAANGNEENRYKQQQTIELLLDNEADINAYSRTGITPLSVACKNGIESIVEYLLQHGSIINYINTMDGPNPLYIACQEGHTTIIKLLLKYDADINLCDEEGAGLLYVACQKGHDSTVKYLLNNGANINLCTENGISPLHIACQEGNYSTVQLLLSNEADIGLCMKNGKSPLHTASAVGHYDIVETLITKKANIDICQNDGKSPLYTACENGHYRIVNLLLSRNADANICKKNGERPLYAASTYGYYKIVEALLAKGANVNVCQSDGESPLYAACVNGYQRIVKLLLSHGANKSICKTNGQSPLAAAQQYGHDDIVQLLREN